MNFLLIAIFAESSTGKNPLTAVTPGLYIWTKITFLLIFYVLAKFAWKPLLSMLEERESLIKRSLSDAETAREELQKINLESEAIITKARTEAQSILSDGKAAAEKIKDDTVAKAKEEASKIREEAKQQIKAEKDRAISDIKKEVVDLSLNVAEKLINSVIESCDLGKHKVLKTFKGSEFQNTLCSHPFKNLGYEHDVPMLDADFVTLDQGTGIVHCAPSHGPDDFNLCLKHGMKAIETVNNDGLYTKNIPIFEGTHVFKADEIIIKNLKEQNNLLGNGSLLHSYPHSWRSKAPLVHRATPQWFISMESHKLRKKAIESIDKTIFFPEKGKARIRSMIETRPDWCISRQRSWGVPLPIFIDKKTNEPLRDLEVIENIAKIYEKEGSDCWFCLLYTSPSPRDATLSRMPSSA